MIDHRTWGGVFPVAGADELLACSKNNLQSHHIFTARVVYWVQCVQICYWKKFGPVTASPFGFYNMDARIIPTIETQGSQVLQ